MSCHPSPPTAQRGAELTILLIEDDDIDAMAVRRMFRKVASTSGIEIERAHDGEEGLEMLRDLCQSGAGPLIVLLDINMPRISGHDFLRMMREDPLTRSTTVFVLTTSADPEDVKLAYERHVAGYLTKSGSTGSDSDVGRLLSEYVGSVVFPPASSGGRGARPLAS